MNPDKKYILDEIKERVDVSPFVLVVDYTGTTVPEFDELRNRLSENGAECHVAKNSFMKRVLADAGLPDLGESLNGQTAFVTGDTDVCAVAKVVANFEKEFKKPEIKAGILDGEVLDEAQVKALAALPARDVLLAQLLSTINAPAAQLVRTLNEPAASLARVIKAKFNEE
ncbi:50S ribosomal protein L10 [Akkermansiaceae bacterium]|nr:50S ribosomal protein L10 [Akkermansiaceae bacterium]MDA8972965.1 50S ribosomal protein L10 [bacterium]MDA7519127.1 50S ribosomal protein L10 [Akkermansiaceae bacterium]MDA7535844.1 50S ribosomal protein L10 [Akkermansiaceae bacterium]MDA7672600.1 50S ribosomal protein L10 [Akkermansiaceae bacterium]